MNLKNKKNEEQARYNEFVLKRRREEKEAQEKIKADYLMNQKRKVAVDNI